MQALRNQPEADPCLTDWPGLSFRAQTTDDRDFLAALYASTREEELRPVPWSEAQKAQFLDSQFQAQSAHYAQHYADARFLVLQHDAERIGRLYLHQLPDDLRIIDIALAPAWRGRGLGTALLRHVLHEAAAGGRSVSIHVEMNNPALRLYQRLGFERASEEGVYFLLVRRLGPLPQHAAAPSQVKMAS